MQLITSQEFGFTKDYFLFKKACYLLLKAAVKIYSEIITNSTFFCPPNFMFMYILTQLCNHLFNITLWIATRSSPTVWMLSSMQKLNAHMKKIVSISYFCKMVILYLKCTRWMFRNIGWKPKLYLVIIYVVQSQRDTKKAEHNLSVGIRDSFAKTPIYSIPHSLNQPLSLGCILFKISILLFDHIS